MPLEDFLPEFDARERHERFVAAPPERAVELALRSPSAPDRIVRMLFGIRRVPPAATLADLLRALGLDVVERTPTSVVACGGAPIRIAVDFVAREHPGGSLLSTETRVQALTPRARRLFRLYWVVVGPFSALVRRRWLRAIARAA